MGHRGAFSCATGLLVAGILAGSLLTAASANAKSTGFHVYNLSDTALKLTDISGDATFEEGSTAPTPPKLGDVLVPGATDPLHVELTTPTTRYGVGLNTSVALTYRVTGSDDTVEVELSNYDRFTTAPAVNVLDRSMVCTVAPGIECVPGVPVGNERRSTGHETLLIVDPPGTVHTVTAADKVKQAEVLGRFCTRGNLAVTVSLPGEIFGSETVRPITCQFDPELPRFTYGPPHITQEGGLINCTGAGIPIQGRFSDKAVVTNSFGVERGHNDETDAMFARAEAAVTKAKGRWFDGYTFTGELPFTVPPASIGKIEASNPIIRHTGDFTVTVGNTIWKLPDVYFDVPDARPEIRSPQLEPNIQPWCRGADQPASGPARATFVTLKRRGDGGSDALLGGPESTTIVALAGSDIVRGASGDDRLYGGPGRDVIFGGPGSDTIVDSRGRTWISTGGDGRSGPDVVDVRDGEGDDTVVCGSRKSRVRADRRDAVRHCG